jgi:hypothetical protein
MKSQEDNENMINTANAECRGRNKVREVTGVLGIYNYSAVMVWSSFNQLRELTVSCNAAQAQCR